MNVMEVYIKETIDGYKDCLVITYKKGKKILQVYLPITNKDYLILKHLGF